jgi:hypothetical protein
MRWSMEIRGFGEGSLTYSAVHLDVLHLLI